ncbi:MAG: peptidase M64 [Bacteroidia bacterium]|nr:MAG: peptidase M64 [Bacteroidia bacterium]
MLWAQDFDTFFEDKTLRFDYVIGGSGDEICVYPEKMKEEPYWGGSKINLVDTFNFGDFFVEIYDVKSNKMIYSRGFSSLFYEWTDTEKVKNETRSFYESVVFPFPKSPVKIKILMRRRNMQFQTLFSQNIDPTNVMIIKDRRNAYPTEKLHYSGDHHKKLDIVIIPEGYTTEEMTKFKKDCRRFIDYFFEVEPFKTHKDKVNFWAVKAPSLESGTDIPHKNIWKNTLLDTHFGTFGTPRYLTTQSVDKLRDAASYVPYDQIYILVNSKTYGGGGIFNYYNLCTADHPQSGRVFTHEFGHAFAALADEYEYGWEKAEDFYDMQVEPWQVNISNLSNFEKKWKGKVKKNTPIPTADHKKYRQEIGAFEGAGYVKKKIYRPTYNCKMRTNSTDEFCPVCYETVLKMLQFYAE